MYQPDGGEIRIDGEPVWDNPAVKRRIAYVPDELYFLAGANLNRMERMYRNLYPDFDRDRFEKLRSHLQLPRNKSLGQFSNYPRPVRRRCEFHRRPADNCPAVRIICSSTKPLTDWIR